MLYYLLKRPMLLGGIICAVVSLAAFHLKPFVFIIGIFLSFLIGYLFLKNSRLTIAFVMVFMVFLSSLYNCYTAEKTVLFSGKEENCRFIVNEINFESGQYCLADVEVINSKNLKKGTKIAVIYEPIKISKGDIIEANIEPAEIKEYKDSYYSKGIFIRGNLTEVKKTGDRDFILFSIGNLRSFIKTTLFSNMGYNEAATFSALLFGDKGYFSDEFSENVRRAGVSHIMVVSGMHLAIFVSFFLYFSEKIFYNRYLKALGMVLVVIFMTALCGFSMSMLRAGVTYILTAIALVIKRYSTPENTLGAAVMIILLFNPFAILSLGFQLSVLATFGILVIALPILKRLSIKNKLLNALLSVVLTSLSATMVCMPLLIYVFEEISLVAVLTNMLISSAVTLAVWLGLSGLFVAAVYLPLAKPILYIASVVMKYINYCINEIGSVSFAVLEVPRFTAIIALGLVLAIFWFMLTCKVRNNMLKLEKMREKIKKEGGEVLKWR